jgi:hypothetical protein
MNRKKIKKFEGQKGKVNMPFWEMGLSASSLHQQYGAKHGTGKGTRQIQRSLSFF